MITAQIIKITRENLKETQAEFGRRFGVNQVTIHRWEHKGVPERGVTHSFVAERLAKLKKVKRNG